MLVDARVLQYTNTSVNFTWWIQCALPACCRPVYNSPEHQQQRQAVFKAAYMGEFACRVCASN